jgi:16S rRNA G1207 methylase RsmC
MELEDINARALNQAQENVEENNCQNDNRPTYFFDIFLKVCVINCN